MDEVDLFRLFLRHSVLTSIVAAMRRRKGAVSLPGAPRILVTRSDGIGDFVMMTPFLRELRRSYPHSRITLVVGKNSFQLAQACPYVNEVLFLDPGPREPIVAKPKNLVPFVRYLEYLVAFADRHLAGQIDIAIQPRWDVDVEWATLVTLLSGDFQADRL